MGGGFGGSIGVETDGDGIGGGSGIETRGGKAGGDAKTTDSTTTMFCTLSPENPVLSVRVSENVSDDATPLTIKALLGCTPQFTEM